MPSENPFRNIQDENQFDHFPRSIKESNELYAKYWKQGFFALVGERHQDALKRDSPWEIKYLDVFLTYLAIPIVDNIESDQKSHLGIFDLIFLPYWIMYVCYNLNLTFCMVAFSNDTDREPWDRVHPLIKAIDGFFAILMAPLTLAVTIPTLFATWIWTAVKVITAAVSVTVTSGIWYGAKLIDLYLNGLNDGDDYELFEDDQGYRN